MTRRAFVAKTAAATSAAAAVSIVPSRVLGQDGSAPPSRKLNLAGIGIGGKGRGDLNEVKSEALVALCDVDYQKAAGAFKAFPDARRYKDYREMLAAEKDLDGVLIATPDHMHFPIAMTAMSKGLHVYCQKPLTHHVWEAREMSKMARKMKVATQMGNQGLAGDGVRQVAEWLADGCIGEVTDVHVWTDRPVWPQGIDRPSETPAVPPDLAWDLWLGVAPERPYNPVYHPFSWRGWLDFGTGALGDIACHSFAPIFKAIDLGHPIDVEASHSRYNDGAWHVHANKETYPRASIIRYRFPARGQWAPVTLTWYDGGLKPPRPAELEDGRELGDNGTMYIGTKGVMLNGRLVPEDRMKTYKRPPETLPRSIGHYKEWLRACRGGEAGASNFDFAGLVTEVVLLGNVALHTGKRLAWDGPNLAITNDADANALLKRTYRDGWLPTT